MLKTAGTKDHGSPRTNSNLVTILFGNDAQDHAITVGYKLPHGHFEADIDGPGLHMLGDHPEERPASFRAFGPWKAFVRFIAANVQRCKRLAAREGVTAALPVNCRRKLISPLSFLSVHLRSTMPVANACRTSSSVASRQVRRRYCRASAALSAIVTEPPDRIELPPKCAVFSRMTVRAPASLAKIADTPPAYP